MMCELKWRAFFVVFRFLQSFFGRGLFYVFIGLLQAAPASYDSVLEDAVNEQDLPDGLRCTADVGNNEMLCRLVPGFFLGIVGLLYFIVGFIACCQGQKDPGYDDELAAQKDKVKKKGTKVKDDASAKVDEFGAKEDPPASSTEQKKDDNPFAI